MNDNLLQHLFQSAIVHPSLTHSIRPLINQLIEDWDIWLPMAMIGQLWLVYHQGLEEDDEFPLPDYSDSDDNDTSFPEDSNVDYESDARGGNIPSGISNMKD